MATKKSNQTEQGEVAQLERKKVVAPPPMYQVWLLNDDYTPMDFVVTVLERFFAKSTDEAEVVMLKVHHEGKAICGEYPRDIAETKVVRVTRFAREAGHPLQCVLEGL
ncbi:MAG: ATP-dependent Clp protease adapter ClpS [Burkholderiaceae bacterium]|jgi:ATP-dependent Clp protease adaptor protein ClpS